MIDKNFISIKYFALYLTVFIVYLLVIWEFGNHGDPFVGDASYYLQLYNSEITKTPYGYRLLTPFLASILPFSTLYNFGLVTLISIFFSGILLFHILKKDLFDKNLIFICLVFWFLSYSFIYPVTTFIRTDALTIFFIFLLIFLIQIQVSLPYVLLSIFIGMLNHEIILLFVSFLTIDKIFKSNILFTKKLSNFSLIIINVMSVLCFLAIRNFVEVEIDLINLSIENFSKSYYRIIDINHYLRIYSAFGPIIVYSFIGLSFSRITINKKISYISIFLLLLLASTLVADTLRVFSIAIFLIILLFIESWKNLLKDPKIFITLIFIQGVYSSLTFFNLAIIETNQLLFVTSMITSFMAVIISAMIYRYN